MAPRVAGGLLALAAVLLLSVGPAAAQGSEGSVPPAKPKVSLVPAARTIAESGPGNSTTLKATQPTAVSSTTTVALSAAPPGKVALSGGTLTIPANATESGTVTVTATDDDVDAATDATVAISGTVGGDAVAAPDQVTLTVTDDDMKGITFSRTALRVAEGGTATYTVVLDSEPLDAVTVTPSSADTSAVTVSTANGANTLVFTSANWSKAQTVTVAGTEDADSHDAVVRVSHTVSGAGSGYQGVFADVVDVYVPDSSPKGTGPRRGELACVEARAGDSVIRLTWTNPGDATITGWQVSLLRRSRHVRARDGRLYKWIGRGPYPYRNISASHRDTVTHTEWGLRNGWKYTFVIRAVRGAVKGEWSQEVQATPQSGATLPVGTSVCSMVRVRPRVSLVPAARTIAESGPGSSTTIKATLPAAVSSTTTVALSAAPSGKITLSGGTLTIPANATESGTVTVTATDDDVDAATDATVSISGTVGSDAVAAPDEVTLTVTDDDTKGITVSTTALTVTEGGTATYTVVLDSEPLDAVTVTPSSADTGAATVSTANGADTLVFTAADWSKAQTVTVTGAEDADSDDETVAVSHTVSGAGSGYQGVPVADVSVTVTDSPPAQALTAHVAEAPSEHGGKGKAFTVQVGFSAPVRLTATKAVAEGTLRADGARVVRARRVDKRRDLWAVRLKPSTHGEVTVTLAAAATCAARSAVCTAEGRGLGRALTHTVPGPAVLNVADARAKEGEDETLDFQVTLARAASGEVSVGYRTRNGTAKAGKDYERTSGTLVFAAGETEKTVSVPLLDDAHDEGEETFKLRLNKATGAVIGDGEAVGTIENDDPMPKAWLARFGRTVAGQAVDALMLRLGGGGGSQVTLGGQAIGLSGTGEEAALAEDAAEVARALAAEADAGDRDGRRRAKDAPGSTRSMTGRDLLLGSSFHLSAGGGEGAPAAAAWGRVAHGRFDGADGEVRLDGEVTTGFVGADVSSGGWLAGAAVAHSEGEGSYGAAGGASTAPGAVESTLTSLLPYARVALTERLTAWMLAGWGTGELTLTPAGEAPVRSDLSMRLGAVGAMGALLEPGQAGGIALGLRGDAFWVRTESDAGRSSAANIEGTRADATRLRLVLDAARSFEAGGGTLTPSLEAGLRHDGGDAGTGTGIEVGGGIGYIGAGIAVEGRVRALVAHEASDHREWGASGALRIDPGASGRGLSLTLAPAVGAASGGPERLWSAPDARALTPGADVEAGRRLDAEAGYGLAGPAGLGTATPYAGLGLADGGTRAWRAGVRWQIAPGAGLSVDGTRSERAGAAPDNGVTLRGSVRW